MEDDGDDENQPLEEGYDEETDGVEHEQMDIDDVPVTQEDAWAVIR
jgi:hypothetical protein